MTAQIALHPLTKTKRQMDSALAQFKEAQTWTSCPEADYLLSRYRDYESKLKYDSELCCNDIRLILGLDVKNWNWAVKEYSAGEICIAAAFAAYKKDSARKGLKKR